MAHRGNILSLYDNMRLKSAKVDGDITTWSKFDDSISKKIV